MSSLLLFCPFILYIKEEVDQSMLKAAFSSDILETRSSQNWILKQSSLPALKVFTAQTCCTHYREANHLQSFFQEQETRQRLLLFMSTGGKGHISHAHTVTVISVYAMALQWHVKSVVAVPLQHLQCRHTLSRLTTVLELPQTCSSLANMASASLVCCGLRGEKDY